MGLNNTPDNRETQARACDFTCFGMFYPVKLVKDLGQLFGRNTYARILDFDLHVFTQPLRGDSHLAAPGGIIYGVTDKIVKDFLHVFRISLNRLEIL